MKKYRALRLIAAILAIAGAAVDGQATSPLYMPAVEIISGDKQQVPVSSAIPEAIIVRVYDRTSGIALSGWPVTFPTTHCADFGNRPCVSTTEDVARQTDASGLVHAPRYTTGSAYGDLHVPIRVPFMEGIVGTGFSLSVFKPESGVPFKLELVSGGQQQVEVGARTAEPLIVRVLDGEGRPVPGAPVTFNPCLVPADFNPQRYPCALPDPFFYGDVMTDANGLARSWYRVNDVEGTAYASVLLHVPVLVYLRSVIGRFTIVPPARQARAHAGAGGGEIAVSIESDASTCALRSFDPMGSPGSVHPRVAFPHGTVGVRLRNCGPGASVKVTLFHPGGIPEGARLWVDSPSWHPIDAHVPGSAPVQFTLRDGGDGDSDGIANGDIVAIVGIGFGDPDRREFQDLWWAGSTENGWGVSINQHGDRLFTTLFVYDASGQPTWFVMPGGSWGHEGDVYSGAIYAPRGAPLGRHRASDLVVGASAGRASITFKNALTAELEIEVAGEIVRKVLTRQLFGPMNGGTTPPRGGMWWGGPDQSGWGLALHQQYSTLFGVIFTYREDGSPTWFAMPSGDWTTADTYLGRVYATRSSPWPKAYDASKLTWTEAGGFSLRFTGDATTLELNLGGSVSRHPLEPMSF